MRYLRNIAIASIIAVLIAGLGFTLANRALADDLFGRRYTCPYLGQNAEGARPYGMMGGWPGRGRINPDPGHDAPLTVAEAESAVEDYVADLGAWSPLHVYHDFTGQADHTAMAVLDIRMPEMSGVGATRAIKARYPQVRVLILTAYDDDPYVFALLQAGADGYVLKTGSSDELVQAVRTVQGSGPRCWAGGSRS
jgi:CheY-like chemotaxis protein